MTLYYYGENSDEAVNVHLKTCASCADEYKQLVQLLDGVSCHEVPSRGDDYGASVWQKIAPQLQEKPSFWQAFMVKIRAALQTDNLVLIGAFALIAAIAFLVGRYGPEHPESPSFLSPANVQNLFQTRVSGHLEQMQMLLTEAQHGGTEPQDLKLRQDWANKLALDNRLYRQVAFQNNDTSMAGFLQDLEFTLLEIANGQKPEIQVERIETKEEHTEILFKIRVLRSEMTPKSLFVPPEDDRAI